VFPARDFAHVHLLVIAFRRPFDGSQQKSTQLAGAVVEEYQAVGVLSKRLIVEKGRRNARRRAAHLSVR
jgi:hypothetical protein